MGDPGEHTGPLSRRGLLRTSGLVAAGAAGALVGPGARPAGADPANSVTISPAIPGLVATNAQAAFAELQANKAPAAAFDIRMANASTGVTDNTTAINNALSLVAGSGGGTVLIPSGVFEFAGTIVVPDHVDLWGCGGTNQVSGTSGSVLKALDGGQLIFRGGGNQSGNFIVDGSEQTDSPADGLVRIEVTIERVFTAMRVGHSTTDGLVLEGAQNCSFVQLYVGHCLGDGLVMDDDSWSHLFLRCEFTGCAGNDVRIKETVHDVRDNLFLQCILERGHWGTGDFDGPSNTALLVEGGSTNKFDNCIFAVRTPNTTTSGYVVIVEGGDAEFDSCNFTTDIAGAGCLSNQGAGVLFSGRNHFIAEHNDVSPGPRPAIQWNNPGFGNVAGRIDFGTCPGPRWGGSGSYQQLSFETDRPHLLLLESDATFALRTALRSEEGNGYRVQLERDGQISVSDGTSFTPKALWKLLGGGWHTPQKVRIDGGLNLHEMGATPANPSAGDEAVVYVKGDKLVVAFNDAGTMRYRSMPLIGTSVTWTHTTTAP
ncbi:MAG TPA: hypothetical protein VK611_26495 [Acidimicrobiales bacterium]|nr:hypothetical protein [Acidimicrobiales bacterium]